MGMLAEALLHENDVVQGRKDGKGNGCVKEYRARDPDQTDGLDLQQKYEKYSADLRERIRFAKDAGAEIPQASDGKQYSAGRKNGDIAAENQNGIFPGNFVKDGEYKEQRAQEQLVSDGV